MWYEFIPDFGGYFLIATLLENLLAKKTIPKQHKKKKNKETKPSKIQLVMHWTIWNSLFFIFWYCKCYFDIAIKNRYQQ